MSFPVSSNRSVILIAGIDLGVQGTYLYYTDRMEDQNERLIRLRIEAGHVKPTGKTALMELTNLELKQKGSRLVERIREITHIHQDHWLNLLREKEAKKLTEDQFKTRMEQERERARRQFEPIRIDAVMVSDELTTRLSPHVHEKIIRATPHLRSGDDPKSIGSITRFVDANTASLLADEIEELSKLQLQKLEACAC